MLKYIKKIKKKEVKKYKVIIAADFETVFIQDRHVVYAVGSTDCSNKYRLKFLSEEIEGINIKSSRKLILDFLEHISKKHKDAVVYFHNLGTFDGIFILDAILWKGEENFNIIIRNSRFYQIKYKGIIIQDSYNILPAKLNTLAQTFLNTEKSSFDITKIIPSNIKYHLPKLREYLKQDVFILFQILENFRIQIKKEYGIDITKCMTLSTLAFSIFRQDFMLKENIYNSNEHNINNFLRPGYLGGISNVFKPKGEDLYYYDINSLYPSSMLKDMPVGKPKWAIPSEIKIQNFFGFIEATVQIPDQYLPPLSIKDNGTILQPVGQTRFIWFSEEINYAIQNCGVRVIKIHKGLKFKRGQIFNGYVNHFYNKRKNTDNKILKYIYKLLLNSLYGRFGLRHEILQTELIPTKDLKYYELAFKDLIFHKKVKNKVFISYIFNKEIKKLQIRNFNFDEKTLKKIRSILKKPAAKLNYTNAAVQISSAIAAYSRINLISNLKKIKPENIYYCDTDSIITSQKLKKKKVSKELGAWKLEHNIKEGIFLSPKCYFIKTDNNCVIKKFKGLVKSEKDKLTADFYKKNLTDLPNNKTFRFTNFFKRDMVQLKIVKINARFKLKAINAEKKRIKIKKMGKWVNTKPVTYRLE